MTKYDCVDCKRPVEIIIPEENICMDCYIVRLKLQLLKLSSQVSPMLALLERWVKNFSVDYSYRSYDRFTQQDIINITKTLLKKAKEVKDE